MNKRREVVDRENMDSGRKRGRYNATDKPCKTNFVFIKYRTRKIVTIFAEENSQSINSREQQPP